MDVSNSVKSCESGGDVMGGEETLEDCMTMLDLAMAKLDKATQGLCSSGLGCSEMEDDFSSLENPPEHQNHGAPVICCDSFLESQNCDGKDQNLFFDLLSVGDESVLNFINLPNGFYA